MTSKKRQEPESIGIEYIGDQKMKVARFLINPKKCLHCIFDPAHYYNDGSCDCYNKKAKIMKSWGYKWNEKKGCWV